MRIGRAPFATALALSLVATSAVAQESERRRPVSGRAPASVEQDPRDAGFGAWRDVNIARARAPLALRSARFEMLLASPLAAARAKRSGAVGTSVDRCAARFSLSPGQAAALKTFDPWAAFDSVASGPFVTITILPAEAKRVDCDDSAFEREALMRVGLRFGLDSISNVYGDVASAELRRGGTEVRPLAGGRVLVTKVAPGGLVVPDGASMVRLYFTYDDLAPGPASDTSGFELLIWNTTHEAPEIIRIPRAAIQDLWHEALVWRAQRAASSGVERAPLSGEFPVPSDGTLREAHASYVAGRLTEALEVALVRLEGEDLSRSDRLNAQVHVGAGFLALDDEVATRVAFGSALDVEPCLRFAESVDERLRTLLDAMRPAVRCEARSTGAVLRASLVPGRGLSTAEPVQTDLSESYRNVTIGFGIASLAAHALSRVLHKKYEENRDDPTAAYAVADEKRVLGNQFAMVAYAAWIGSAAHALIAERAHARRVREYGSYGAAGRGDVRSGTSQSIAVRPSARGFGLAIHFF
jgi:hypothetical protein